MKSTVLFHHFLEVSPTRLKVDGDFFLGARSLLVSDLLVQVGSLNSGIFELAAVRDVDLELLLVLEAKGFHQDLSS